MNEIMRISEFDNSTPVLIPTVEQPIEMSVADVLKWVAPNAPPFEAMKFLMACRMAQVNPFLGEAHLVDHGGRFTTIIDKSGYLKRAQAHPDYEGHEAGIIAQALDPKTQARGPLVDLTGSFLPPGHVVVGGWAKVFRRGVRKPIEIRVSVAEYNRGTATWKTLTSTMIRKVALVQALRESGLISSGWYAEGEVPSGASSGRSGAGYGPASGPGYDDHMDGDSGDGETIEAEYRSIEDASLDPESLARLLALVAESGMTDGQFQSALHRRGVTRAAELTNVQATELIVKLSQQVRAADPLAGIMPGLTGPANDRGATGGPTTPAVEAAPTTDDAPEADGHADADASEDADEDVIEDQYATTSTITEG